MDDPPPLSEVAKGSSGDLKDYACLPCRQRKIKCDRHVPCNNCSRSSTAQKCSFVPPARGTWKRKQTKPPKEGLHAKLKRYEQLLKSLGADIDLEDKDEAASENDLDVSTPDSNAASEKTVFATPVAMLDQGPSSRGRDPSHFVGKNGISRYFDSALWTELGQMHPEIDVDSEAANDEDDRNEEAGNILFLDPILPRRINLTEHWPSLQLLSRLKTVFLDRGDPLLKVFHIPTFWDSLTGALQSPRQTSKGLEAAMLAWCFATVSILEDGECISLLGAERRQLFSHFRIASQRALAKAGFLHTSDLDTLRAYMCYLVGIRSEGLCASLFVMSGVAVRLARTMGLHRDGTALGLPPFETEMRRRLWWHLVHLDFRAADMHGALPTLDLSLCDTKYPLNLEDTDLHPDMTEFPKERTGITGITGCVLRCEIIEALRKFSTRTNQIRWDSICDIEFPLTKKEAIIKDIESHMETKYLRYCDPVTPYHQLIAVMVRLPVCWMRFFAHNPRPWGNDAKALPRQSRDIAFNQAIKMLEYASWMHSGMNGLGKFMWQSGTSVLWRSMLYVLIEIRHRKTGLDVDRAWHVITEALTKRPQLFEVSTPIVYRALTVWTLEVWDECSPAFLDGNRMISPGTLELMEKLRQVQILRKQSAQWKDATAQLSQVPVADQADRESEMLGTGFSNLDPFVFDFPPLVSMASDSNGWATWEEFLAQDGSSI